MRVAPANPLGDFLIGSEPPTVGSPSSGIDDILDAVREHLGMEVAFASRFIDGRREFTHLRSSIPLPVKVGDAEPLEQSLCRMVRDGLVPELVHDAGQLEASREVPIVQALPVGAHLNVPLRLSDGTIYGSFCCVSRQADWSLTNRDMATLRAFADLAARQVETEIELRTHEEATCSRIVEVLSSGRLTIVHQPIHRIADGVAVGVECLSRFADAATRTPDQWFSAAAAVGLGNELELLAVARAVETIGHVPRDCYVSINASPELVLSGALLAPVAGLTPDRLVIEVTEHSRVADYKALAAALEPLRAHARIAIDDVGAGYAGLRHIVDLKPDILKLDMSLTRDLGRDPARRALAHALVLFAREIGCGLIAEGVETASERAALERIGVTLAQGFLFSRPMPVVAAQQLLLGRSEASPAAPARTRPLARRA